MGAPEALWKWPRVRTCSRLPEAFQLNYDCNEFYLFHGSHVASIDKISLGNFDLSLAKQGLPTSTAPQIMRSNTRC